jgi:hypothetical protein
MAALIAPTMGRAQVGAPPVVDLATWQSRLASEGDRNRVLNEMEIGTRLFEAKQYQPAAAAFDEAIVQIESVYANDPNAKKALSVWSSEGAKTFKGEPYERVMAYYYRGLIYLAKGDYENARAAFRQGQLQDAFAQEQQNQCDFAIMLFLEAWASHQNGDKGLEEETMRRLKQIRPSMPDIAPDADTLVIAETGTAPRKLGDGASHSYFVFRRGKGFTENRVEGVEGARPLAFVPMEDIYYQATTRGGREIDKVLQGKVAFKQTTGGVGSALTDGGVAVQQINALAGGGGTLGGIAAGVSAIGGIALLMSANANPTADTRTWTSLPDLIHIGVFSSKIYQAPSITIHYLAGTTPGAAPDADVAIDTDIKGKHFAWVRSR